MKPNKIPINDLNENPDNPRYIKGNKFNKLVKSIKEFPEMLQLRPIVVDEDNIILGGNMRYKASLEAGLKYVYVIQADNFTEQQKKEFIIKDNSSFGEWDWDILANTWNTTKLKEWGLDTPKFDLDENVKDYSNEINENFRVEVECIDEEEQEKLYNELINKGYKCRLLTL